MDGLYEKKAALADFCRLVHSKHMVYGSGGNISMLSGDTILISPSGRSLGSLTPEDIIELSFDGSYRGTAKPSSEMFMHIACYRARPDISVVLHVHSVYATAVSCLKDLDPEKAMPVYTPGYGKRIGALPAVPYYRPGSHELAESAGRILAGRNSVLLQNHGVITVAAGTEMALNLAEDIEENAQLTLLLGDRGRELSPASQADLVNYGAPKEAKKA